CLPRRALAVVVRPGSPRATHRPPTRRKELASLPPPDDGRPMPRRKREGFTSQPHDALIKYTFSQREHAAGLLKAALAPEIIALIRWGTLELTKIHFVDRGLRNRYADLFFSAETVDDDRLCIYVLIEHQSRVERLMIF